MTIVSGSAQRAAHAVEVGGERRAQLHRAAAVEVAEALVGRLGEHAPHRAQPGGPRERREVGAAVAEVDRRDGGRRARRGGRLAAGRRRASARPGSAAPAPPACSRRCGWSGTPRRRAARRPRPRRPRETPSSAASARVGGSATPPGSAPDRIRSRIDASIWRCSASPPSRSSVDQPAPRPVTNWYSKPPQKRTLSRGPIPGSLQAMTTTAQFPTTTRRPHFDGERPAPRHARLRRRPRRSGTA